MCREVSVSLLQGRTRLTAQGFQAHRAWYYVAKFALRGSDRSGKCNSSQTVFIE